MGSCADMLICQCIEAEGIINNHIANLTVK